MVLYRVRAGVGMNNELPEMRLKAIGMVRNEFKPPQTKGGGEKADFEKVVSEIVVEPALSDALDGLDEFSHIIVIYWMHKHRPGEQPTRVRPRGNPSNPLTGLFATRSPNRPNPLGKATVRLLQRWGNTLLVEGLDAIDGTPVIDIKPYIPGYDSAANARIPQWMTPE
jgi:tRNA-Thr(GGU) m(6)t(6)A37 methyltransferase TsaA